MSDVLLGHSFFMRHDTRSWSAMQPYPPLATLYAAACLRERGHDLAFFDAMLAVSETDWSDALDRERPRFAVLFEDNFNFLTKMCLLRMREAAFTMIRAARERGCTVIAGGSDATDRAEAYLRAGVDFVLIGEGDATLVELLEHLRGPAGALARRAADGPGPRVIHGPASDLSTIAGLAFLDGGRMTMTPPRPPLRDLDALPFPAWDLLDLEHYRHAWRERHGYFSVNLATSRGCPYHCNWCAKPIWGQRYQARSPENVVREIEWLRRHFVPDHLWFTDDILGLQPGWLARFAELLVERDARVPFKCLCRPDLLLRDGRIEALSRAGCEIVWMGAESGSQRVLDAMEKGVRVEAIREATGRLREAGIRAGFFLQFGYPGETREDIEATLRLVRDCRPDDIGVSVSYPLPGTKLHQWAREELAGRENWVDSADLAMLYRGPYGTRFYRRLHTLVHREFRLVHAWHDLRGLVREPRRLRPRHLRRAGAALAHLAGAAADRVRLEVLARADRGASSAMRNGPRDVAVAGRTLGAIRGSPREGAGTGRTSGPGDDVVASGVEP